MPVDNPTHSLVYCDGASKGNPGHGGWAALVLSPTKQVYEVAGYAPQATNNQMELRAAIEGLTLTKQWPFPVRILTDSSYVIQGVTAWIFNWQKRGWLTLNGQPVANRELWEQLLALTSQQKVLWQHVRGHAGIPGNEKVDTLASAFALGQIPKLYSGPLNLYDLDEAALQEPLAVAASKPAESKYSKGQSPSGRSEGTWSGKKLPTSTRPKSTVYLSLVDGVFAKHATWPECAAKVQGRSGAKYRKAQSPDEEEQIKKGWGLGS